MDKQIGEANKMVEEIARDICGNFGVAIENLCGPLNFQCDCKCKWFDIAERFYNAGYRKIPEGAVVLTKKEYDGKIAKELKEFAEAIWDNATNTDEVGTRWVILQEARKRGVTLDRELKRYGGTNKPV